MLNTTSKSICRFASKSTSRSYVAKPFSSQQIREHSVKKKNNMARFFPETYLNGSRILPYWLDHNKQGSKVKKLDLTEMSEDSHTSEPFPLAQDASVSLSISAPEGYIADRTAASNLKLVHFFQKRSGDTSSAVAIAFSAEHATSSMERVVQMTKMGFWSSNPFGQISDVKLASSATSHLRKKNVQLECMLFDTNGIEPRVGQLTCLLKTPGGVWKISWHTTMENMFDNSQFFATILKGVKLVLNRSVKPTVAVEEPAVASDEVNTTTAAAPAVEQPLTPLPQASVTAHGLDSEVTSTESS